MKPTVTDVNKSTCKTAAKHLRSVQLQMYTIRFLIDLNYHLRGQTSKGIRFFLIGCDVQCPKNLLGQLQLTVTIFRCVCAQIT